MGSQSINQHAKPAWAVVFCIRGAGWGEGEVAGGFEE